MKIFHNAKIYGPQPMAATAFSIDYGQIIALGSDADLLEGFTQATWVVNLRGKTVWPGLTDSHLHLRHLAQSLSMIDCETDSLQTCLDRISDRANCLPPDAWMRGHGWNQNRWDTGFGNANMLDQVCGGRPAYLTAKSLHAAWVNSKALTIAGINAKSPDPPNGIIQRGQNGQPTGILFEAGGMELVESIIPKPSLSELTTQFQEMIPRLWEVGLIGVHDFDGVDSWQVLQGLNLNGELGIRVCKMIPFDHLDTFIKKGYLTGYGDDRLNIGWVKLFSDGALGPQTAAMRASYEGSDSRGTLLLTEDELIDIGIHASHHGIALSIHAIGDLANHIVLNAFQHLRYLEREKTLPHYRHRIEHVQIIDTQDLPRLAELDIIASVQPVHAPSDMEFADKFLGKRSKYSYAYRSLLSSGACLVLGSDAPVEPYNPFHGLHAAVTRRRLDGMPGDQGWQPVQRLSLQDSLSGFTQMPAETINRGGRLGKIAPHYKADFIILEHDPFLMDPHQLGTIKPEATFIDGKCVYQSPSSKIDFQPI